MPPSLLTCGGCQQSIGDRFFLKAIEQYWHEDCLSCDLCGCRLGEVGRRLYYKLGRKLCRRDYLRLDVLLRTLCIGRHGTYSTVCQVSLAQAKALVPKVGAHTLTGQGAIARGTARQIDFNFTIFFICATVGNSY